MKLDRIGAAAAVIVASLCGAARPASAQTTGAIEAIGGWAAFVDDSAIHHSVIGAALPVRVTDWLRVGPELLYMIGPGSDRDLLLFGSVFIDLVTSDDPSRPPRVVPYLTAGGGLFHHSDRFGGSSEGYAGAGVGTRVRVSERVYLAPEMQVGWELHVRAVVRVGFEWPAR